MKPASVFGFSDSKCWKILQWLAGFDQLNRNLEISDAVSLKNPVESDTIDLRLGKIVETCKGKTLGIYTLAC